MYLISSDIPLLGGYCNLLIPLVMMVYSEFRLIHYQLTRVIIFIILSKRLIYRSLGVMNRSYYFIIGEFAVLYDLILDLYSLL